MLVIEPPQWISCFSRYPIASSSHEWFLACVCCILINVAIEYVYILEKPLLLISVVNFALGSWRKVWWFHEMGSSELYMYGIFQSFLVAGNQYDVLWICKYIYIYYICISLISKIIELQFFCEETVGIFISSWICLRFTFMMWNEVIQQSAGFKHMFLYSLK